MVKERFSNVNLTSCTTKNVYENVQSLVYENVQSLTVNAKAYHS